MAATDAQVQAFVDERLRPLALRARAMRIHLEDFKNQIDDVYANLTAQNPTWSDQYNGHPAHFLTKDDVLAVNALVTTLLSTFALSNGSYAILEKACPTSVEVNP